MDLGVHGGTWNLSPRDTERQLYMETPYFKNAHVYGVREDTGSSPGLARGLRVWRCCELGCGWQVPLSSGAAGVVVEAGSCVFLQETRN